MKKIVVLIVFLLLAGAGIAAYWAGDSYWPFERRKVLRLPGIVEVQEVRLGSKVGGRVEAVLIHEGEKIYKNKALVVFEAPELKNQKQQAKARLDAAEAEWQRAVNGPRQEEKNAAMAAMEAAKARWNRAKNGWREEEKLQAQYDLDSASADYAQMQKEWDRVSALYREKAVARTDYDAALALRDRASARMDSAKARVNMMKAGTRSEDKIEAEQDFRRAEAQHALLFAGTRDEDKKIAKAKVDELKANLEAIDISLAETTIIAPPNLGEAVVEVIAVRPGDLVPPNQPVVRVLRIVDLWVKVFVPETQYGLVTLDMKVDVTIDSHPGKIFKGVVVQRANISEFTPRNVQSVDERRHQVFAVKIRVEDPQRIFNAGMAAQVEIPLE